MSGTKFTPGPWAAHCGRDFSAVYTNDGIEVCYCDTQCEDDDEGTVAANARLIAAAPEMYALLERFAAWYDLRKLGAAPTRILDEMAEGAKKTLAALRGEGA